MFVTQEVSNSNSNSKNSVLISRRAFSGLVFASLAKVSFGQETASSLQVDVRQYKTVAKKGIPQSIWGGLVQIQPNPRIPDNLCSGFFMDLLPEDRGKKFSDDLVYLVTCKHCTESVSITDKLLISQFNSDKKTHQVHVLPKVAYRSNQNDIWIYGIKREDISTKLPGQKSLIFAPDKYQLVKGDICYCLGSPFGSSFYTTVELRYQNDGPVPDSNFDSRINYATFTGQIMQGISGGPIVTYIQDRNSPEKLTYSIVAIGAVKDDYESFSFGVTANQLANLLRFVGVMKKDA